MLHKVRFGLAAGALVLSGALGGAVALAADEPANVIKYRKAIMSANGGHMGALAGMAKGEVTFTDEAAFHAEALNQLSQNLERLFPEGTGKDQTEEESDALLVIWEKPDEFRQAIQKLQEESAKLAELTASGSFDQVAFAQQIGQLGKQGCGGCHETFREKDD
jgi:cytochrome c556